MKNISDVTDALLNGADIHKTIQEGAMTQSYINAFDEFFTHLEAGQTKLNNHIFKLGNFKWDIEYRRISGDTVEFSLTTDSLEVFKDDDKTDWDLSMERAESTSDEAAALLSSITPQSIPSPFNFRPSVVVGTYEIPYTVADYFLGDKEAYHRIDG